MGRTKRNILKMILIAVLFIAIIYAALCIYTMKSEKMEITEYEIDAGFDKSVRIVQISDLHNREIGKENCVLIDNIRKLSPDIICLTGDIISRGTEDFDEASHLVEELCKICDVYYCYGNHEYFMEYQEGKKIGKVFSDAGAMILEAEYLDVTVNGNPMRIGGYMGFISSPGMTAQDEEEEKNANAFFEDFQKTDKFKLLLNHIPTSWVDWGYIDEYDVNMVLSGHYHGGQIVLPGIGGVFAPYIGFFPDYVKGMYKGKKAACIISAGLGSKVWVPRINNRAEIVCLDLR